MYVLAIIEDKVKIEPEQFERDQTEVLTEQIDIKFINKVLTDVGLCVSFYDYISVDDPYVYPAEGAAHQLVQFRLVIFRPFVGEILIGKILSSSREGINVTLNFFDDIFIPSYLLQQPAEFNEKELNWEWKYGDDLFVMEPKEEIRFRVRTINFTRVTTSAKGIQSTTTTECQSNNDTTGLTRRRSSSMGVSEDAVPAAMQIIGSINEDGLGLVSWW